MSLFEFWIRMTKIIVLSLIAALVDQSNIQPEPLVCAIANRPFLILG
jgi:hypothetical protein